MFRGFEIPRQVLLYRRPIDSENRDWTQIGHSLLDGLEGSSSLEYRTPKVTLPPVMGSRVDTSATTKNCKNFIERLSIQNTC